MTEKKSVQAYSKEKRDLFIDLEARNFKSLITPTVMGHFDFDQVAFAEALSFGKVMEKRKTAKREETRKDVEKPRKASMKKLYKRIRDLMKRFDLKTVILYMGGGKNFRNDLKLCREYKGNRSEQERPEYLDFIRNSIQEYFCEENTPGIRVVMEDDSTHKGDGLKLEADDLVEIYGFAGYNHYKKTGKFNHVVIASEKDARGHNKLLIDATLDGGFLLRHPYPLLIEGYGRVYNAKSELKGHGYCFRMAQAFFSGDTCDNYFALKHLKDSGYKSLTPLANSSTEIAELKKMGALGMKKSGGIDSLVEIMNAYDHLEYNEACKNISQLAVDYFEEIFPFGVIYSDWEGNTRVVSTLEYMEIYFAVSYMKRSRKDTMNFEKTCNKLGVDISGIQEVNYEGLKKELVSMQEGKFSNYVPTTELIETFKRGLNKK